MKYVLKALLVSLLLVGVTVALPVDTKPQEAKANTSNPCPAGSYLIGYKDEENTQPLCKLEPTGCPYGDSIPLGPECDKHAPGTAEKQQAIAEHDAPFNTAQPTQAAQCGGK